MPRSLVESDFYRLAPQGRHLAGWAGGINKVVQSISGATRELRGQYFLFFDNAAAAAAYKENLRNLFFEQAKHTGSHPPASDPNMVPGTKASAPTCFSLLPPDAKLSPVQLSIPQLAGAIAANQAKDKEEGFLVRGKPGAPNRSSQQPSYSTTVPYQLPLEMAPDGEPTLVERSRRVLVRLAGSKITAAAMARFIEADGAERNLPWRLIEERPGVRNWPRPLQALQAGSGPIAWGAEGASEGSRQEEGGENPPPRTRGYTRFVVTFADAAEAKRFARTWHRRELLDERTARTMVVNAHALW
ncbi:uncharacterized protein THITE_2115522 [Thermothielavioides terrestris NRRL 8126]|jgi:hypothetical protein|uniref:Uncharacterized protein n=1 Tax=Thermothielavioides terrestris (strain ATCC 38088 / NRRL 8126) TaxID=578455 RepID=G2R4V1_THETT|nr:uncharacterized protein THITE_2115522 [Thermothielavioides terrestris NRRL 8126]AEO66937.1 hypothetical protein THITE_2115522 [Thermothielavioides terrestris NRRL 8126]